MKKRDRINPSIAYYGHHKANSYDDIMVVFTGLVSPSSLLVGGGSEVSISSTILGGGPEGSSGAPRPRPHGRPRPLNPLMGGR